MAIPPVSFKIIVITLEETMAEVIATLEPSLTVTLLVIVPSSIPKSLAIVNTILPSEGIAPLVVQVIVDEDVIPALRSLKATVGVTALTVTASVSLSVIHEVSSFVLSLTSTSATAPKLVATPLITKVIS